MTKDQIQDRITTLETERNQFIEQAKANIAAMDGAIQDCKYWSEQADKPADTEPKSE